MTQSKIHNDILKIYAKCSKYQALKPGIFIAHAME